MRNKVMSTVYISDCILVKKNLNFIYVISYKKKKYRLVRNNRIIVHIQNIRMQK